MRVLVGYEESQEVCKAFRELGHEAYSCDIQECSCGKPEWHIKGDAHEAIIIGWDLILLHPPCTALAVYGNRTYGKNKPKHSKRIESAKYIQKTWELAKNHSKACALENPVGVINRLTNLPKPQYIQPWQFGHGETKKTGFWLWNLPPLKPTNVVDGREQRVFKMPPSEDRGKLRSKTYPGIAKAIAEQWGGYLMRQV